MVTKYNYKLSENLFAAIESEFDGGAIAKKYVETKDKSIFNDFGKNWMKKTLELGNQEQYIDHTYEMIKKIGEKTGQGLFPNGPQRFIEIAYLSVHLMGNVNIHTSNLYELSFKVLKDQCKIYKTLESDLPPEELKELPCKGTCTEALKTLFEDFKISVDLSMPHMIPADGECFFMVKKK
ncbi:MAG: hypothetical protein ACFFDN_08625 [Candidatus Hodarchaeota archaeon]